MALLRILDERIQQFEMRFIHPTGELRTINVLQHAVKDENDQLIAVEGIIENITEQKQRIIQLAASESKFRTFIETANDLIFSINSTGCFTYLSPNTMDTLGYSPNELQGVAYAEIVHPDD